MTKTQRQVWYALGHELYGKGYSLCCLCSFMEASGNCDDGEMECKHTLEAVYDRMGEDCFVAQCWGFRPRKGYDIRRGADMVGVVLQGYYPESWATGVKVSEHEVRVFDRLVAIGEVRPYVLDRRGEP